MTEGRILVANVADADALRSTSQEDPGGGRVGVRPVLGVNIEDPVLGTIPAYTVQQCLEVIAGRAIPPPATEGAPGLVKITPAPATVGDPVAVGTNDPRLLVGDAATARIRALGTGAQDAAAGDDSRFPTSGEKAALAGSSGSPGAANRYLTGAEKGAANGVATLDGSGNLVQSSPLTIGDVFDAVISDAAMIALAAQKGDIAIRTDFDPDRAYILGGDGNPATLANWKRVTFGDVVSVFGRTGVVGAQDGDYNASQVVYTPSGNIAATRVGAAIAELDSEKQATSQKGQANGYAALGSDGLVPPAQLPASSGGVAPLGLAFPEQATISANTALTASAMGKMHPVSSATSRTITLPDLSGVTLGGVIGFRVGIGVHTLAPVAGQTIQAYSSYPLWPGDFVFLVAVSATAWVRYPTGGDFDRPNRVYLNTNKAGSAALGALTAATWYRVNDGTENMPRIDVPALPTPPPGMAWHILVSGFLRVNAPTASVLNIGFQVNGGAMGSVQGGGYSGGSGSTAQHINGVIAAPPLNAAFTIDFAVFSQQAQTSCSVAMAAQSVQAVCMMVAA